MELAAVYARYSSDNQSSESIDAQLRAIKDYCSRNNIAIVKTYIDEAESATSDDRPQFLEMIRESAKRQFNLVIVHKLDRFARNRYDSAFYKRELEKNGVKRISVLEQLDDSPESIILESVLEGMAEYYSKNLARETLKGMNERVEKGLHMGQMPYGYYVNDGQVYINDIQANVIKQIFDLYNNGWGHMKITKWLNDSRIPTYKGIIGGWQTFQVRSILTNIKYIGKLNWNKKIYDSSSIPPILTEESFFLAQRHLIKKKKEYSFRGNNFDKFVLLGFLKCGLCGSSMRIKNNNASKPSGYYAYVCHSAVLYRKQCTHTTLHRSTDLEEAFESEIEKVLTNQSAFFEVEKDDLLTSIVSDEVKQLKTELDRAEKAYLAGAFSLERYIEIKSEAEKKLETKTKELSKIESSKEKELKKENKKKTRTLWQQYKKAKTIAEKKKILNMFIKAIVVFPEYFVIKTY